MPVSTGSRFYRFGPRRGGRGNGSDRNTAGQGSNCGFRFEQIARIISRSGTTTGRDLSRHGPRVRCRIRLRRKTPSGNAHGVRSGPRFQYLRAAHVNDSKSGWEAGWTGTHHRRGNLDRMPSVPHERPRFDGSAHPGNAGGERWRRKSHCLTVSPEKIATIRATHRRLAPNERGVEETSGNRRARRLRTDIEHAAPDVIRELHHSVRR